MRQLRNSKSSWPQASRVEIVLSHCKYGQQTLSVVFVSKLTQTTNIPTHTTNSIIFLSVVVNTAAVSMARQVLNIKLYDKYNYKQEHQGMHCGINMQIYNVRKEYKRKI